MVGPRNIALEGRGWTTNCLQVQRKTREEVPVWHSGGDPTLATQPDKQKLEELSKLKQSMGFNKRKTKVENVDETEDEMEKKKQDKLRKYLGKSIVIGMITEVFFTGNTSTKTLESALELIRYGVHNNFIDRKYQLEFNFDPVYKVDTGNADMDDQDLDTEDSRVKLLGLSKIRDFWTFFMEPTMKPL